MRILIEYIRAISLANAVWGVVLSALGIWWIRVHLQEKKEKDSAEKREIEKVIILLQGICPVWIKRKDGELVLLDKQKKREKGQEEKPQVLLDGIAPIWREAEVVKADVEEKIGTVNLQNVRAARFFRSLSKINKKFQLPIRKFSYQKMSFLENIETRFIASSPVAKVAPSDTGCLRERIKWC